MQCFTFCIGTIVVCGSTEHCITLCNYRNQKFFSLTRPGNAYRNLLSNDDVALLPLLSAFQRLSVYRRVELPADALKGQAFRDYYQRLINKYLGDEKLFW